MDGEVQGHTNNFKMELSAPQPVLVIKTLSKKIALALKKAQIISYTMDLQTKSWLSNKIKKGPL